METELANVAAQLGAAGIMGVMWLAERRAGAVREKHLAEAHDRLMAERTSLDVLLRAVESTTRVLGAIEAGQRQLLDVLTRRAARPARNGHSGAAALKEARAQARAQARSGAGAD